MSDEERDPRVEEAMPLLAALLESAAAAMGPALGVELEFGGIEADVEDGPPEGELAVLPVRVQRGQVDAATIEVVVPLDEILALARRVNGVDEPEAKDEISADDASAIGELLRLVGGGVDEAVRGQVDAGLSTAVADWWRSDEPGSSGFAHGQCVIGAGAVTVPGGPSANLYFRISPGLLSAEGDAEQAAPGQVVLLLEVEEPLRDALRDALEGADRQVHAASLDDEDLDEALHRAGAVFVSAVREDHGALCRELRLTDESWRAAIVVCVAEPTRESVIRAMHDGASGVLRVPAEPAEVRRVLAAATLADG